MLISPSIEEFAGATTNLQCSIAIDLPDDVIFEWFFGPNSNDPLPSGVTDPVMTSSGNNYTSTIQLSPLLPSHTGMYTCRLRGKERIAATTTIFAFCKDGFRN